MNHRSHPSSGPSPNVDDGLTSLSWLQNLNMCMTRLGAPTPPTPPASPNNRTTMSSSSMTSHSSNNLYSSSMNGHHQLSFDAESASSCLYTPSFTSVFPSSSTASMNNGHFYQNSLQHSTDNNVHQTASFIDRPIAQVNRQMMMTSRLQSVPKKQTTKQGNRSSHKNRKVQSSSTSFSTNGQMAETAVKEADAVTSHQDEEAQEKVDYKTNGSVKPPFSYATLICMAMNDNKNKMTLNSIYKWIRDNFLYYQHADPSWQNSIRHNLSLNKCFIKIPRTKEEPGKGGFWRIDPLYAETLVDGVFKKRRPAQRLPNVTPSSYVYSRKRKKKALEGTSMKEEQITVDCMEIEQALQSIGKPIEAVLDESGTVVTLIPCLETMEGIGSLSPRESGSNNNVGEGGCLIQSMTTSHHVMHETPPSSAESYPTVIDGGSSCETIELVNAVNGMEVSLHHASVSSNNTTNVTTLHNHPHHSHGLSMQHHGHHTQQLHSLMRDNCHGHYSAVYGTNTHVIPNSPSVSTPSPSGHAYQSSVTPNDEGMCIQSLPSMSGQFMLPGDVAVSGPETCWNTILETDLEFVNPVNYSCQVVQHESSNTVSCSCDECIVGNLMTNYIA